MPDETTTTNEVKTSSDGQVKISVEKYNEMVEKIAEQKSSIGRLNARLDEARSKPPVINRTVVNKTAEMAAQEYRVWGGTFMGLGAAMFVIGAGLYRTGLAKS